MRIVVYTDYTYRRLGEDVYAERAFALFVDEMARHLEGLTLVGRVDPRPGDARYRLTDDITFVPLPFYETITRPHTAVRAVIRSLRRFWNVLDDVEAAWLLGPHPLALLFAALAAVRGRTVVLGVRQDMRSYVRSRHPRRRWLWVAGDLLERAWRATARHAPVIVVGPELARQYAAAPRLLSVAVSLVRERDVASGPAREDWDGETLQLLSVGRLEREKNPLLLADVLARLLRDDPRWRLRVCGEGPLQEELARRLEELGVSGSAELLGYLPLDGGLFDAYRDSHALLHVSWTEGLPQILFEAFAAGLPVVATDVGGIRAAVGDAATLVPAGDAEAAAAALERLRDDEPLRARLVEAGIAQARTHTLDAEVDRVAEFILAAVREGSR